MPSSRGRPPTHLAHRLERGGLIAEIPDIDACRAFTQSDDGVLATLVVLEGP
jgi:hypothetical protein